MSKKKGLSSEEKRTRMLQLFYEKKDFFQMKELEKIAPKEKGIVVQSVKDVVQSLVDDGLVDTDKIGTSVYFWAYPSQARHSRKRKLEELEKNLLDITKKVQNTRTILESAKIGKEDTEARQNTLATISQLKVKKDELEKELKKYSDYDPDVLNKMKNDIKKAKEAANRWTDNIFAVKSWCRKKYMIESTDIDKQFQIPCDLDYID